MKKKNFNKLKHGDTIWWNACGFDKKKFKPCYVIFLRFDFYFPYESCTITPDGINIYRVSRRNIFKSYREDRLC